MAARVLMLGRARRRRDVGSKARSLARLAALGFDVPDAWVIPSSTTVGSDTGDLAERLSSAIDHAYTYAVRSSASVEDGEERSYAGQFLTILDVPAAEVPRAVLKVAAPGSGEGSAYGTDGDAQASAVLIQRMVHADAAGVVFSRNPVSGIKECVIEAVCGTSEDLLAGRARPQRWVRKHGEWLLKPDDPLLPDAVAGAIADGVERMERAFGTPVDAEWAHDGSLWWLQVRPITAGARPSIYSSRMARDMLPGIILPLVWSVNGPLKSGVFLSFLEDVFGPLDVDASELGTLIHYRFYINVGALSRLFAEFGLPEESLELLAGMERGASMPRMPHPTPRALRRLPQLRRAVMHFGRYDRILERELPGVWERSRAFAEQVDPATLDAAALLDRIDALEPQMKESTYHHVVTLMLLRMFSMRLRSRMQKAGLLERDEPVDLRGDGESEHDVGHALDRLAEAARALGPDDLATLRTGDLDTLRAGEGAEPFLEAFDEFMHGFGHLAESGVDLSSSPWSEQPERILQMVAVRLDAPKGRARGATEPPDGRRLRKAWDRAARYHTLRDETSSLYTYTYGLYRPLVLALADRLIDAGALEAAEDIFYLTLDELRRIVRGSLTAAEARAVVVGRRDEVEAASKGAPPEVVVGETADLVEMPKRRTLRGIASSRGRYTGRVVVCRGLDELERISEGDVVVVPFSDASWTPLFTHAGAIIAESGGLLSHSAILARELGVPAIVSVRGALALEEGTLVTVDGFEGTVAVLGAAS